MKARMILQGKRSAITLCMCLGFATPVAAATQPTATQPPLGVLIVPADEIPQTPANPIARPVPENRPLGILLGPGAPPKPTATAVPDNPFPLRKPLAQPSPPLAPVPQSTSVRPLGLLLDPLPQFERPPLDATLPIAPSRPSVPKTGTSAPPVYAPPAGATTERPLGTLFGITAVLLAQPYGEFATVVSFALGLGVGFLFVRMVTTRVFPRQSFEPRLSARVPPKPIEANSAVIARQ